MEISHGNIKIGKDTLIINITSAHDCRSDALGLCAVSNKCYAKKSEKQYPAVLPYRRRQEKQWDMFSGKELGIMISNIALRKRTEIKFLRVSEAGDLRNQEDLEKLKQLALNTHLTVYTYTARNDLNFANLPDNLIVNGSGFDIDNAFSVIHKDDIDNHEYVCPGVCLDCSWCKEKGHKDIRVVLH